jgi:hypothetical protein
MWSRHGHVVANVVRSPVRPATLWIRVVSMASASVIYGRIVVSRRASMDVLTLGRAKQQEILSRTPASPSHSHPSTAAMVALLQ